LNEAAAEAPHRDEENLGAYLWWRAGMRPAAPGKGPGGTGGGSLSF